MGRRSGILLGAAVLAAAALPAGGAGAAGADGGMRSGVHAGGEFRSILDPADGTCSPSVAAWAQELRTSGVTRIRAWFATYSPYQPVAGALASRRSTEVVSVEFDDDSDSHHVSARMPAGLWKQRPNTGDRLVLHWRGERPSLWEPDVRGYRVLGRIACAPDPGGVVVAGASTVPPTAGSR